MFRPMRRIKQQLDNSDCLEILNTEKRGVLSIIGDDGYPYGIPINFYFSEPDNKIYFHGARKGHKIDSIMKNDKACLSVFNKGIQSNVKKGLDVKIVIIFGRIKIVNDDDKIRQACANLAARFTFANKEYIEEEIKKFVNAVAVLELSIEHMTGKIVNES